MAKESDKFVKPSGSNLTFGACMYKLELTALPERMHSQSHFAPSLARSVSFWFFDCHVDKWAVRKVIAVNHTCIKVVEATTRAMPRCYCCRCRKMLWYRIVCTVHCTPVSLQSTWTVDSLMLRSSDECREPSRGALLAQVMVYHLVEWQDKHTIQIFICDARGNHKIILIPCTILSTHNRQPHTTQS